jgi:hypothetical protein
MDSRNNAKKGWETRRRNGWTYVEHRSPEQRHLQSMKGAKTKIARGYWQMTKPCPRCGRDIRPLDMTRHLKGTRCIPQVHDQQVQQPQRTSIEA